MQESSMKTQRSEVRSQGSAILLAEWLLMPLVVSAGWGADGAKLEAHTATNGTLSVIANGKQVCEFTAGLFDENWRSVTAAAAGNNQIAMKTGTGVDLKGEATFTGNQNGTVSANYSITPFSR